MQATTFSIDAYSISIEELNKLNSKDLFVFLKNNHNYDYFLSENKKLVSIKDNILISDVRMGINSKSGEIKSEKIEKYHNFLKENCFFIFPNNLPKETLLNVFEAHIKTNNNVAYGNGFDEFKKIMSGVGCIRASKKIDIAPAAGPNESRESSEYLNWWNEIKFVE